MGKSWWPGLNGKCIVNCKLPLRNSDRGGVMDHFFRGERRVNQLSPRADWDVFAPFQSRTQTDRRISPELADMQAIEHTPDRVQNRIRTLLGMLDTGNFDEAQAAQREIRNTYGEAALPFLRQVLRHPPNLEMQLRAEAIIRNIMGASAQHWSSLWTELGDDSWRVAICRDGSNRITQLAYPREGDIHTTVQWNGLNQIEQLVLIDAHFVTNENRDLIFYGWGDLSFRRTANGYQVTRLDGGPLPAQMQTAQSITINDQGVITVVWANGSSNTLARQRPRLLDY